MKPITVMFCAALAVSFAGACSSVNKTSDGGAPDAHQGGTGGAAGGADGGGGPVDAQVDAQADGGNPACASAVVNGACTGEGAVCGSCTDPCNFCNTLRCTGGRWTGVEAAPAPCFACGPSGHCQLNSQYCFETVGGAVGNPPSYHCSAVPTACLPVPTCACVGPPPAVCRQADAGALTFTLAVP